VRKLYEFKKELDKISPTFCVAKWKQVTMHLESGLTHSCHHPKAHTVPLDELESDVSSLHNTKYKKRMRKDMLEGKIIPECEYCNRIEQYASSSLSDRIYKSYAQWAKKYIKEITNNPYDYNVFPSYFEVSFNSVCNCSCIYCSSTFSTGWFEHIKKFGGYPTSISSRDFNDNEPPKYMGKVNNPYIEAFWKWWPSLYKNLDNFRITGGEPLLSKDTFKILDYIIQNPKPNLQLDINTNFSIDPKIFNRFIGKYKQIGEKHKHVGVFTSCEAKGIKAEYIRPGMNYNHWLENCRNYLLKVPNGHLTFMCTYNILSISSFQDFLKDVLDLKKEFRSRVKIDIPFLMTPSYLQANIITKDFMHYIKNSITFMYNNLDISSWPPLAGVGFWEFEISKLQRIYNMVESKPLNKGCIVNRKDFVLFVDEYDRRYHTQFLKVFPEYKEFYLKCKEF